MTNPLALVLTLAFGLAVQAETLKLDTLKVGSTTYSNVTILGANATDLYFRHSLGFGNVKLKYVGPELQKRFDFDPKAAAEAEKRQNEQDLQYQSTLAVQQSQQAKAGSGKPKALLGTETGLADPISDKSLLGKSAPKLEVDKWIGDKPSLEGKFVLITFWAPWSTPCRQWIPELNALQKKYGDKLVVIGVSTGSETELSEMPEPRADFALGVDGKARLGAAAGITAIPSVLLCDPKGVVLYEGHPAALTEKKLQAILARPTE